MTYRLFKFICVPCDAPYDSWQWDTEPAPTCFSCGQPTIPLVELPQRAATVIGDDIPGGMVLEHVAFKDGRPQRFYSKNAMREAARAAGWTEWGGTPKDKLHREI